MADRANGMNQEPDMRSAAEKEEDKQQSEKANEYVRELLQEKHQLENAPNAVRLLDQAYSENLFDDYRIVAVLELKSISRSGSL
ncbi:hypothetical protein TKK_0015158 [Trichogramma kaykai]